MPQLGYSLRISWMIIVSPCLFPISEGSLFLEAWYPISCKTFLYIIFFYFLLIVSVRRVISVPYSILFQGGHPNIQFNSLTRLSLQNMKNICDPREKIQLKQLKNIDVIETAYLWWLEFEIVQLKCNNIYIHILSSLERWILLRAQIVLNFQL